MKLITGLNTCFNIVISSKSEQDFYMNVYRYYDYIFTHPELLELYEAGGRTYRKKHIQIWDGYDRDRDSLEISRDRDTYRMEKADMYSNAVGLEVRVYEQIKHYFECDTPDTCGAYEGALLVQGLDYVLKRLKADYRSVREQKKIVTNTYNGWYKNQRDHYQQELSQFHAMFLMEIEKLDLTEVPQSKEIKPFLNLNTGDFTYYGKTGNFPTSGQGFKVLKTLLTSPHYKATHAQLVQSYLTSVDKPSKTQKGDLSTIIRNIKRKLGVLPKSEAAKPDPFVPVRNEGYRLEIPS